MKTRTLPLTLLALATSAATLPAQTTAAHTGATHATAHPATHRTGTTASSTGGGCMTLPPIASKVPALPAGASCPKPLYTLERKPDVSLQYVSPLVGPEVLELLSAKPIIVSLGYVDTQVGTGEPVRSGKWLTVNYTGYLPDGTKFDSSLDHGKPISFPYGQHRVIAGWDTGFEGMKVGGKRRLFIPYQLAYGDQGRPPAIPPKSMLVFDMELISEHDADPDAAKAPATPGTLGTITGSPSATSTAPEAKPSTSPAGAAGTPPVNSSTPASSTQPATKPETK